MDNELQEIMVAKTTMEAAKLGDELFFKGVKEQTKILQVICQV
jgi:hypothetical protein